MIKKIITLFIVFAMIFPSVIGVKAARLNNINTDGSISVYRRENETLEQAIKRGMREAGLDDSLVVFGNEASSQQMELTTVSDVRDKERLSEMIQKMKEGKLTTDSTGPSVRGGGHLAMTLNYNYYGSIDSPGMAVVYQFTPTSSGRYAFESTGSTDTLGFLFVNSEAVASDDQSGEGNNFRLVANLQANQAAMLVVYHHSPGASGYTFFVNVKAVATQPPAPTQMYSPQGGSWTLTSGANPSQVVTYKMTYWDRAKTAAQFIMLSDPGFANEIISLFVGGAISTAASRFEAVLPGISFYSGVVTTMVPLYMSFLEYLDYQNLKSAAKVKVGANGFWEVGAGVKIYSLGVPYRDSFGNQSYILMRAYDTWTSAAYLESVSGATGYFNTSDFTPMF